MDIDEVLKRREDLQREVMVLLRKFTHDTNISIAEVRLEQTTVAEIGQRPMRLLTAVRVDLLL